jgi:gelsolin
MPPHDGLTHLKEYDIKDSNVEFIGTDIDHHIKYASAETEPAWNDGKVGKEAGLYIWRIEDFQVVPWPKDRNGQFYTGDSYIVLYSYKVGKEGDEKLCHDIFFWLGSKTSQDEAGTAAYKTVELDEILRGAATQHREIQQAPSDQFLALFPTIKILSGGVRSGFMHVDKDAKPEEITTLLRIFKQGKTTLVHEVEPVWQSLDEEDVFVLDKGDKIWVWQGKKCSPMEKAKAAQVVNDLTIAKHVDVEVLAQAEARSGVVVGLLGGKEHTSDTFKAGRPVSYSTSPASKKLFRISDASGQLSFNLVKEEAPIQRADFDTKDVFLLDTGKTIWVWRGINASAREKAMWMKVAQSYIRQLQSASESSNAYLTSLASVSEGHESPAFFKAIEV